MFSAFVFPVNKGCWPIDLRFLFKYREAELGVGRFEEGTPKAAFDSPDGSRTMDSSMQWKPWRAAR